MLARRTAFHDRRSIQLRAVYADRADSAAKSIIDAGADWLGDATASGFIQVVLAAVAAPRQYPTVLVAAMVSSAAAIAVSSRLNRGYIQTLEKSLLNRALDVDPFSFQDLATPTLVLGPALQLSADDPVRNDYEKSPEVVPGGLSAPAAADPEIAQVRWLRTHDHERSTEVLRRAEGISALLVAEVIPFSPGRRSRATRRSRCRGSPSSTSANPLTHWSIPARTLRSDGLRGCWSLCAPQRAADGLPLGPDGAVRGAALLRSVPDGSRRRESAGLNRSRPHFLAGSA